MRVIDATYQDKNLRYWRDTNSENGVTCVPDFVIGKILNQPTIDAEPVKHGHWVFVRDRYLCSICGEDAPIDSFVRDARHKERQYMAPYCYECGAKMDEE